MWLRNLLFIGLVLGGVAALGAALFPRPETSAAKHFHPEEWQKPEFRSVVDQVDATFRQQWSDLEIQPAGRAPDLLIARRLSLALTGNTPSLQEIRQVESWPADQRLQRQLAGLLQDPRFGDYWAERLARVYVGVEDGPFLIYRRRRFVSWLSDNLMKDQPYDSVVHDLIAGRGLWTDTPGTNFLTVTVDQGQGKKGPNPERLAGRISRAFLGFRLDCAQCHNHPFEKWKKADFQGLAAFFGQVKLGATGLYDTGSEYQVDDRKSGAPETIEPKVPFLPELVPPQGNRRQQLTAWITDPRNPYFARATVNRVWALLFGRPLVEPVDSMPTTGDVPRVLQLLADDFAGHHYDVQRLVRVIASTEVFQLDSAADHEITDAHDKAWAAFPMTRLRPEQVAGSILQSASLTTLDRQSHILQRFFRSVNQNDFVKRYGDTGDDEFDSRAETIPQRLLMMNGQLLKDKTQKGFLNADTRIAWLAPDDHLAVETAYLAVLTRHPTPEEAVHFEARLGGSRGDERSNRMEDLYWTLLNTSECSWNH